MQLLSRASKPPISHESISNDDCARQLLDTVPLVMRIIRAHMRQHRSGLTIAQFRTLCFVSTADGSSLSATADFIGLSLPAMSRLVDALVEQRLMERKPCADDRRHVRLSVTRGGETAIRGARQLAQSALATAVRNLTAQQRTSLADTMQVLRDVFTPELNTESNGSSAAADHGQQGNGSTH